jgi:glycosyltransferase involved in cell wall biosynthesis
LIELVPMKLPRISIVTPSFNQVQFVSWTVRSVLSQRYPNLEYILMDGGSTDGSIDALMPYAERLAYLTSEKDGGQSDAIFRGFERSTGEIMTYLNSDDMLAPGALHFVARYFAEHPRVDMIYSHRCIVDDMNKVIGYWWLPRHSNYLMMRWDLIPQETCFWRRSLFKKCGNVDPTFRFAMDYDLFVRYMSEGHVKRVNRFLGAFRIHSQSKTSTQLYTLGQEEISKVWKKYGIKSYSFSESVGRFFQKSVQLASKHFIETGKQLPGALQGTGYDYDEVWGGLLDSGRLPSSASNVTIMKMPFNLNLQSGVEHEGGS